MVEIDAVRRKRAAELLKDGTEAKRWRHATHEAQSYLQEAHDLAWKEPKLQAPWPQITAYRLAHIKMRSAKTYEDLLEVDELFLGATGDGTLGLVPRIYRLGVLKRLWDITKSDYVEKQIGQVFDRSISELQRLVGSTILEEEEFYMRTPLQAGLVNMLELAAYFLDRPYTPLEGLHGPYLDLNLGEDDWYLLGHDPILRTVRYPRQLAEAELEALEKSFPSGLFFKLPLSREEQSWKLPDKTWTRPRAKHYIRLLACLLLGKDRNTGGLTSRVLGEDGREDNLHQVVERLRTKLTEETGKSSHEIIRTPSSGSGTYTLSPKFPIYGIVCRKSLQP